MKKYMFLLLALSLMLPLACEKEKMEEEPSVWVNYTIGLTGQPAPWGYGAEETFDKQRITNFFADSGIEILEVRIGSEMPGGQHHTGPPTNIYCRIYEKDLDIIQEYGFDFFLQNE